MGIKLDVPGSGHLVREARERSADRLRWARTVRGKEIAEAIAVLRDPRSYGVVLTGDASLGKSAVASVLVSELEATAHTVRLRSTIVGRETPYGALALLLARLPEVDQGDPGSIMRGILKLLAADAGGRMSVVALETANNLDELSTATLVNVMVTGTSKLIIVADRASDLPVDFHWMIAEERLREVPLAPLAPEQTLSALSELLGGLVPRTVGLQLHAMSRGNPQVALLTVSELLQKGLLAEADGVWRLSPDADTGSIRQLDDLVRARIEREPADVQTVIEALACARRISLERLVSAFGGEVIARMEDAGLIAVDEGGRHSTTLTDPLVGDVVRGWLSVPRRRELRRLLLADGEPPLEVITTVELLGLAAWTRECHTPLPVAHAIAAAAASLRLYDPGFALECLDGVEREPSTWPTVQRLRARASLALQLPRQALQYLEDVTEEELDELSPTAAAKFAVSRAEATRWVPGRGGEVAGLLADARGEVLLRIGMGGADDAEARHAMALLDLAEFEHAAFTGDYAGVVDRLEAMAAGRGAPDDELRLIAACILMEARTVLGREQEALALMHEIASQLDRHPTAARLRHEYASRAFVVLLYNGHWRQCLALLKGMPQWPLARLRTAGASVELAMGLAYVYAGRGRDALSYLLSATALLEQQPVLNSLGSAYAATAFAYAQLGDAAGARLWLTRLDGLALPSSSAAQAVTEFCAEMARRWIGDPGASRRLVASAQEDILRGRWNRAGIKLVGATVEGGPEELRLLEAVCARRQGPLAEVGLLLARGSRTGDLAELTRAADLASGLELDALESRCAAVALEKASEQGDTVTLRLMQARLDALAGRLPVLPVAPSRALPVLTVREREVAVLAAKGTSNRKIAEDLGLSVRTVEGHLYQVFAKLSVSTRSELAGIL
ncbi:helix-turn-helix transcriptional regulator [Sinomonas flava]|uniref:HTH luxR-type domain-containing protein n=1 Tax=Sinomonas flava TaxID=496857 RepID=A0ABN3BU75_9MICC